MEKQKLLKNTDWKPNGEGDICKRDEFYKIIPKPLLKAVLYMYDLNVRTVACGINGGFGISFEYDCFDDENKKIVDDYLKKQKQKLIEPCIHAPERRFRLEVKVDLDTTTEEEAENLILKEIEILGLQQQDVLYGKQTLKQAVELFRSFGVEGTEDELIEEVKNCSQYFVVGDEVWANEELYNKHMDYLNSKEESLTQ